ncbi:uncharacterized protein LOC127519991 isoform X1 [Ctenopharyngodon idella]|uniref:uncharacterized protein LOC127519991 isoform X1 n=1 Tax=Ctenopharyngodon idella TaxID=7959 RepID=UPI00222E0E47|nr:uncharacterized protein LOC127519991 isoform X1 [Ctenopharyngodon idella]XP_051763646.1 uncharacterized protein LOC127519991 isoform X1 [Ctenopharyngodon idella]XP_051763647.1 uncharacterized protein LOC127519991 isoform X1 [Ctenopharyngodon idella]
MTPILKFMLALATVLGVVVTTVNSIPPKKQNVNRDNNSVREKLQIAGQNALDAIGSKHTLSGSQALAGRGQHVFNNGLLKFHRSVLKDLLKSNVRGYDELDNMVKDLRIPLIEHQQKAISTIMVVDFSLEDKYEDFNAEVFGEYARLLREALVAYLKADIYDDEDEKNIIKTEVQDITSKMVDHEVYVDPMARDRWLQENPKQKQLYNEVSDALIKMFQNILEAFKIVSKNIKGPHKRKR